MKIAFFEVSDWEKEYLSNKLKKHSLIFFSHPLTEKDIPKIKDCNAISIFIYSKIGKNILEKLPKLNLITTRSTGFDHIDLEYCKNKRITITNVPFYGENTVAEHAFALILSLSRNIHESYARTLKNNFSIEGLTGFDLKDKTLGLVGGGSIGMHVARMAKGFQMKVLVYDIVHNDSLAKEIGFSYISLEELLKKSDVISMHVPHNKFTHHLMNKENLNLIKKGAVLINTSRGGVIDTDALIPKLKDGTIKSLGLDVIEGEELMRKKGTSAEEKREIARNLSIFKMDNVIFTSHNAFNSKEAITRILNTTINNLTQKEKNLVNQ